MIQQIERETAAWVRCPKCGSKTRTQIRKHTVLEDFPLFCPKCRFECVIQFRNGRIEEMKLPKGSEYAANTV